MKESSNERYEKDKKLWDINNDMGYGEADIENWKIRSMQNERFRNDLIKIITTHSNRVDRFEAEYKKTSDIITDIENFYYREKRQLDNNKIVIEKINASIAIDSQKKIRTEEMRDHAVGIRDELKEIKERHESLYEELRFLATRFTDEDEKMFYHIRINKFCSLFNKISYDIRKIREMQKVLVKKIRQ